MHTEKHALFHLPKGKERKKKKSQCSNSDNFKLLSCLEKERTPEDIPQEYILEGLQTQ